MAHACLETSLKDPAIGQATGVGTTTWRSMKRLTARLPGMERVLIDQVVSQVFGVGPGDLQAGSRGRAQVARARQVAMYLAHVACGLSLTEVGRLFARDRTTVAHACSQVEDQRDEPVFDYMIELLEGVVNALVSPRPAAFH